jgi:cyclase
MVSRELSIPVIASGGAGSPLHFLEAIRAGASACAAASIFHFTEVTPIEVKSFLSNENIPVRYVDKALL